MYRFLKNFVILLILSSVILFSIPKNETCENINEISSPQKEDSLLLVIDNNTLVLYESENIIKSYDINLSVLPSDDILLLSNGIRVKNIAEADEIAENFDG